MCGIVGFFEFENGRPEGDLHRIAHRMVSTLRHRGPDGQGILIDASVGVALGHTRLAVVDLSSFGAQPMVSANGRFAIIYNGEIYNYLELRAELAASGQQFRGHSDTEVILEGCANWGFEQTIRRLNGMFALAIWDRHTRSLFLARDRLGIKPLYWARLGSSFVFGSELKAIRAWPHHQASIDRSALAAYLRFGYIPVPLTIYRDVSKLPPGTIATVRDRGPPKIEHYWSACSVACSGLGNQFDGDDEAAVRHLDALLSDAVKRQMVADVPLGAFLSGGTDSSTVVALMQSQSNRPVKTYSIGFGELAYNEAPYARKVAAHLGTDHTECQLETSDALKIVQNLSDWCDEPLGDSSQIPTYLVSALARQHVTVALSGDGGDELFLGYDRYADVARVAKWLGLVPQDIRQMAKTLLQPLRSLTPAAIDTVFAAVPSRFRPRRPGDKLHRLLDLLPFKGADNLNRDMRSIWPEPEEVLKGGHTAGGETSGDTLPANVSHHLDRMQLLDLINYLPDDILTKVDRASMAVSLEVRVPLLDHRVVEFSWTLPHRMKIRNRQRKWLLRRVLDQYVPRALVERPKMGFELPLAAWLRGPMRDWAESLIDVQQLYADGLFNPQTIRRRWDEHIMGQRNWQASLWSILMFQSWKARWLTM